MRAALMAAGVFLGVGCAQILDLGGYESDVARELRALGQTCTSNEACITGSCADGVCCDAPCDGACERCRQNGLCGLAESGTACDGETQLCDAAGTCTSGAADVLRGYGAATSEMILHVAVDAQGNHIVVGRCYGAPASFGGEVFNCDAPADLIVAKLDADGAHQWSLQIQGFTPGTVQESGAMAIGEDGGIYVGVYSMDGVMAGGMTGSAAPQTVPNWDAFLLKIRPSGGVDWVMPFTTVDNDLLFGMVAQPGGGVILGGMFSGTFDTDAGPQISMGSYDMFVAGYTPDGVPTQRYVFGGPGHEALAAIAYRDGVLYLGGNFDGTLDMSAVHLDDGPMDDGMHRPFVAKLSWPAGEVAWALPLGDSGTLQQLDALAIDSAGGVAVAGMLTGMLTVGEPIGPIGVQDIYVARLDTGGAPIFARRYHADAPAVVPVRPSVTIDRHDNVIFAGHFVQQLELDGATLLLESGAPGGDAFVIKLDPAGTPLWLRQGSSVGSAAAIDVAVDNEDRVVVIGQFDGQLHIEGVDDLTPAGGDGFLARFAP